MRERRGHHVMLASVPCMVVEANNVRCNNTVQLGSRTVNVFLVNGHITEYHTSHFIQSVANSCAVALPIQCDMEVTKHTPIHRNMTKRPNTQHTRIINNKTIRRTSQGRNFTVRL